MGNKIKNIGSVQPLDEEGFIINDLSLDNLQPEYLPIVNDILKFYKTEFPKNIHSVYLRGSVAKGKAVPNISDIDTFAISYSEITRQDLLDRIKFYHEMTAKYPFLKGIEIFTKTLEEVQSSERLQFLLQSQCLFVEGKDLRPELPKFGIGEWAYAHSNDIDGGIKMLKGWLEKETAEEDLKENCTWIMKRTVRIGFELVMEKEQCFTRDLYPCYERFAKHYPEKAEEMRKALELAVFPTADMDEMWAVLNPLTTFLKGEVGKRTI